jgi:hypothetical protein
MKDNVTWPPAMHAKDSKAVPDGFNKAASALLSQLLDKKESNKHKDKASSGETGTNGNIDSGKSFDLLRIAPPDDAVAARFVNGKAVFEQDIGGKKFFWCSICSRWTTTHHSGTHVRGFRNSNKNKSNDNDKAKANLAHLPIDPSIWYCSIQEEVQEEKEPHDLDDGW